MQDVTYLENKKTQFRLSSLLLFDPLNWKFKNYFFFISYILFASANIQNMNTKRQDAIRSASPLFDRELPTAIILGRSKNEENFGLVTTEISDLFVRLYKIAPLGSEILNLSPLPIHSSQLTHNSSWYNIYIILIMLSLNGLGVI